MYKGEIYYNLIAITDDVKNACRIESICKEFDFTYKIYSSIDQLVDSEKSNFFLVFASHQSSSEMSGYVQTVKYFNPVAFIVALVSRHLDAESSEFIKKAGASAILLEEELYSTSKVEFLSVQIIRTTYLPVKISELKIGTQIDFSLHHMMPINKRYIKINRPGFNVTEQWKQRNESKTVEMYIHRSEVTAYYDYLASHKDFSMEGMSSTCRAAFLNLHQSFIKLIVLLSDQSETNSFGKGKEILEDCGRICKELLAVIVSIKNPLTIINNIIEGEFGSLERTPGQAALSGLIASKADLDAEAVMLATLLNNLGLIALPYSICKKIKEQKISELSSEDLKTYHRHPTTSINLAISRKLPLSDYIKSIIMCTHERIDGKGFPNRILPERISEESQLIQFNEELDYRCVVRMGHIRKEINKEFVLMVEEYLKKAKYSPFFIQKIKDVI